MKTTISFDNTDRDDMQRLQETLRGTDMRLALWDINQRFRNALKYEGFLKEGEYLSEEASEAIEKMWNVYIEILQEHDLEKFVLEME
jgi:hypothetical protein